MALTPNLQLNKPTPLGDIDQWPFLTNDNWDILDTEVGARIKKAGGQMTGALGLAAGSIALPGLYFNAHVKTGLYEIGENEFGVSVNETHATRWRKSGVNPPEQVNEDLGFNGKLRGYVDDQARFLCAPYEQVDANNGGIDVSVRRGGVLEHALRLSKDGYLGLNLGSGVVPSAPFDLNGALMGNVVDLAAGSTVNVLAGNVFKKTITGNVTWTFSNIPATRLVSWLLVLTNPGAGIHTWPGPVTWDDGVEPAWTISGIDVVSLMCIDGGTTILGSRVRRASA